MATKTVQKGSAKWRALQAKHRRIDHFAFDSQDRNETFRFAQRQGLSSDELAKAMSRNFRLNGTFDGPWVEEDDDDQIAKGVSEEAARFVDESGLVPSEHLSFDEVEALELDTHDLWTYGDLSDAELAQLSRFRDTEDRNTVTPQEGSCTG